MKFLFEQCEKLLEKKGDKINDFGILLRFLSVINLSEIRNLRFSVYCWKYSLVSVF